MIQQIKIRGFDSNFSYIVGDSKTKEIGIVDPDDADHLIAEINHGEYQVKMILITHSHFDHVAGVERLLENYDVPVYLHENAEGKLDIPEEKRKYVGDGDFIQIGGLKIEVIDTPGHIDDAVCYYISEENSEDGIPKILTGDTLFVEGCGRADLAGSNVEDLYDTLEKLKKLPDNTEVFAGHDYGSKPVSSIGWEKQHNKYLLCADFQEFKDLRIA